MRTMPVRRPPCSISRGSYRRQVERVPLSMPSSVLKQRYLRSMLHAAIVTAALSAPTLAPGVALAAPFVEPPVFTSSNGVLDLLMVALPLPVTSLIYVPPYNAPAMNPTGWVYQICQRAVAIGN